MAKQLIGNSRKKLFAAGIIGVFVALESIISSVDKFNWVSAAVNFLYFMCFVWIVWYLVSSTFTTKQMFRSLIVSYSLTIILRDLVFPAEGLPKGLEVVAGLLAVSELAGLVILDSGWKNLRSIKPIMIYIVLADVVISSIWTWNVLTLPGNNEMRMVFTLMGYWTRPLVALCIAYCYISRMKAKKIEQQKQFEQQ